MSEVSQTSTVAIFDLDGTLTWRDTLVPFLVGYLVAHPARLGRLWRLLPALAAYAFGRGGRGTLKAQLIHMVLGADSRAAIDGWATRFVAAMPARGFFRPQARAVLEEHLQGGDLVILLSASPDIYVPYVGRLLGCERTICTEVNWRDERLDGTLRSANRRGAEKLRVIESLRREHPQRRFVAYGNSSSDLEHLCATDRGLVVNAGSHVRRQAHRLGLDTAEWR